ncbi:MAG: hypothetical protein V3S32_07855 [Acidimicrobiia bacterium]
MIEITLICRHPTPGGDTCWIHGFDLPLHGGGGASPSDVGGDDIAVIVVYGEFPGSPGLFCGDLASDVGDDRAIAGQFTGGIRQFCERGNINIEMNNATIGADAIVTP